MPLGTSYKSKEECISSVYKTEIAHGKPKNQATAISLSHCGKLFGGIKKKDKKNEILFLKLDIEIEQESLKSIEKILEEKKKWMQGAVKKKNVGKTTEECKKMGYDGVTDECLKKLIKRGGKWAQRANFAKNSRKIAKGKK